MSWINYIAYFFGGVFLTNSLPHIISGLLGRAFQTPFAKPPGKGLSSSVINVVWGFFNLAVAYYLVFQIGNFDLRSLFDISALGTGAFLIALFTAWNFGKLHGGNKPSA